MGLRAASVRHPNAVVMAPALTEAGQSQNFTLPPSSPLNSAENGKDELKQIKLEITDVTTHYLSPAKKRASSFCQLQVASDINQQLNIIMSTYQQDTMGLQKTGIGTDPMATLLKDKPIPQEVEQLLNNFTTDMGGAGDMQHVEDLMQALKTIETGAGDRETIFPISFDRELFAEVDNVDMICDDEHLKDARAKEVIEELQKKQLKLERRLEFLLRRIRKIQARVMGQHVSDEIAGLYEYVQRTLRRVKDPEESEPPVAGLNTRAVNALVRKLHLTALHQSTATTRHKHSSARYFGSGSQEPSTPSMGRNPAPGTIWVPRLPAEARDELERVAGTLQTELSVVENQLDSDATASSSGAESADEMQVYNNPLQEFLPINKRAAWRYANERAAVASRWTWLQAQISDLEYRIRQHNELHRQIRACKGAVVLGESAPAATILTSSPTSPSAVNGYRGQLPGALCNKDEQQLANGAVSTSPGSSPVGCARTRPLHRISFRKRKLLQTTGLHTVSKKASRPSNIRCGCVPPVVPCALCTGRTDPTFPRDVPEQLTVPDRIALLDPGYHPVLSFPDDISQSIHLEAIMKLSDWQQKSLRCNSKSLKGLAKAERGEKHAGGLDGRSKKSEHRRKYNRLLKNELKNKIGRGRRGFSRGSSGMVRMHKKRHTAKLAMAQLQALALENTDELEGLDAATPGKSTTSESLTPSPVSHSHVQVVPYRRNRVDSYDIDNIVIPYSVAAATRVEKLQYKEILTPKWRVIDNDFPAKYDVKNNGIVRRTSEDSDVEDISEDITTSRHDKCEHEEKKKFLSYIKFPLSVGRSRANRRTDSRAESSGANTPDPMSPAAHHQGDSEPPNNSPITSPPATPVSMLSNSEDITPGVSQNPYYNHRRRTMSQNFCLTPEVVEVAPYELRTFPLPEDAYENMLKLMPEGHLYLNKQSSRDSDVTESQFPDSRADTPVSDSNESIMAEEDPNDPEWEGCKKS